LFWQWLCWRCFSLKNHHFKGTKIMQNHLFLSESGDLFDTRRENWGDRPLRAGFAGHRAVIKNGMDLRATLRAGGAAWPGGYTVVLFTADGDMASIAGLLRDKSALRTALRDIQGRCSGRIVASGLYQEGPLAQCCYTNETIESDYGDAESD
jgi:hypothetical protein